MTTGSLIAISVALAMCFGSAPTQQSAPLAWADVLNAAPDAAVIPDADVRARLIATGLPWRVRDRTSGIEMLLIPPGKFTMGVRPSQGESTHAGVPADEVTIAAPFYLGRTEVTQEQWEKGGRANPSAFQIAAFQATVEAGREVKIKAIMDGGYTRKEADAKVERAMYKFAATDQWPVESVSSEEIESFLGANELRLPTEAEWEYSCRATTTGARYGELDEIAWVGENAHGTPHAVATKQANAFGVHDMLGNVWEWCSDRYQPTDPTAPTTVDARVLRGGNWLSLPVTCTSTYRIGSDVGRQAYGVRVARNP